MPFAYVDSSHSCLQLALLGPHICLSRTRPKRINYDFCCSSQLLHERIVDMFGLARIE